MPRVSRPKTRRPKQPYLPEMEPPRIRAIETAAEDYREKRDSRMAAGEEEVGAKAVLIAALKTHNLTSYEYDGYTVELSLIEGVKVKAKKEEHIDIGENGEG